ncbi:DUF397 domain-containing protein [Actinomadura welshii]|uniref:DUF397 domain-containing protein n=1 Tax=Actinomadura welshii TaxID=3103817 RepID=UPI0009DDEBCA|nr:DUF397 domain-containing protein [Actinomadura madurae]
MTETRWRKSSYSGSQDDHQCVELAALSGRARFIAVRDSTAPEGPRLTLTPQAWRALLTRLKQDAANLMC